MDELPAKLRLRRQWSSEKKTVDESEAAVPEKAEGSPTEWETIVLEVKVPARKQRIPIEMDVNDSVLMLKEKVLEQKEMYPVPVERVVLQLHKTHVELLDQQLLKDCPVFDFPYNEIDVYLKPPPPPPPPPQPPNTAVLKVTVVPMNSKEKIEMEVKAEEKVAVLREKLEQVHQRVRFRLPTGGRYFFVHKLNVMNEAMSFQCHSVRHGDTIGTLDSYLMLDHNGAEDDKTNMTTQT